MDDDTLKQYLADDPPTIVPLDIKPHFEALTESEKLYAHHISVASWAGFRIVLEQVSPESPHIYDLILAFAHLFAEEHSSLASRTSITDRDLDHFGNYCAQFLGNGGNYKSFGDTKFLPRITKEKLALLCTATPEVQALWEKCKDGIYSAGSREEMMLGWPKEGHVSGYYPNSPGIGQEEVECINTFLSTTPHKILPENTRMSKSADGNYSLLIASATSDPSHNHRDLSQSTYDLPAPLSGKKLHITYGDYSPSMAKIAQNMSKAKSYAANPTQAQLMQEYSDSFSTGSCEKWKQSQRTWIKDKSPTVESDIGFIETYRDPSGIRGEWEGFVAMVNKSRTQAFQELVESAPHQIPKLPWSADFEKDKFLAPDFTSLEVLTFSGSGIPAGINIPNYDDIRQSEGFKNVSLGNVLSAKAPGEVVPFIHPDDLHAYKKYRDEAFEVQVGLHELLGHGCGKLLQETAPGEFNFDKNKPPSNPITGKPVDKWYKPGETWGSVFGSLAGAYEECRAECVAMFLCCDFDILKIFGFEGDAAKDVLFVSYLQMARAGVAALEFWDPKTGRWGQPHMQARYSILATFLDAGEGFCTLQYEDDKLDDLSVRIDRDKIISHGRPAMAKYLQRLQVYKATADIEEGRKMFEGLTTVVEWWREKVRPVVLAKKQPRKVFVQANTIINKDGKVELKEYPSTTTGMMQSFLDREYI